MGYDASYLSHIENGTKSATAAFAEKCDEVFQAPGTFASLHALMSREALPEWFAPVIDFEGRATRIHEWSPNVVPGLAQVEAYARSVIRAGKPRLTDVELERNVASRMARKAIFDGSPMYWPVISEAALRQNIGGSATMAAQLDALLDLAASPDSVLQVLPFATSEHPGVDGPISIYDFDGEPSVAYVEFKGGGVVIEAASTVADLVHSMSLVRVASLPPRDSTDLLREIRNELA
jgi:hypothetical protein